MPTVASSDQTPLHYRVVGDGPRNVLLVHGWMMSGAVFDELVEKLDTTGLRLVIPDLRGAGGSGMRPRAATRSSSTRATCWPWRTTRASSASPWWATAWVARWPSGWRRRSPRAWRAWCCINTVPASGMQLPPDAAGLFRTSAKTARSRRSSSGLACKQLSEAALERLLKVAVAVARGSIEGSFDAWTGGGFEAKLASITAPTLVVATDDPFLPPAFLREKVVNPIRTRAWRTCRGRGTTRRWSVPRRRPRCSRPSWPDWAAHRRCFPWPGR